MLIHCTWFLASHNISIVGEKHIITCKTRSNHHHHQHCLFAFANPQTQRPQQRPPAHNYLVRGKCHQRFPSRHRQRRWRRRFHNATKNRAHFNYNNRCSRLRVVHLLRVQMRFCTLASAWCAPNEHCCCCRWLMTDHTLIGWQTKQTPRSHECVARFCWLLLPKVCVCSEHRTVGQPHGLHNL